MTPANDNRPAWFNELLASYRPYLQKRCRILVPAAAEDAYQEAVCRALEQSEKYRPDGHFPTWLNYIVLRIQFDWRRREFKRPYMPSTAHDATQDTALHIQDVVRRDESGLLKFAAVGHTGKDISKMFRIDRKTVGELLRDARVAAANDNTRKKAKKRA